MFSEPLVIININIIATVFFFWDKKCETDIADLYSRPQLVWDWVVDDRPIDVTSFFAADMFFAVNVWKFSEINMLAGLIILFLTDYWCILYFENVQVIVSISHMNKFISFDKVRVSLFWKCAGECKYSMNPCFCRGI